MTLGDHPTRGFEHMDLDADEVGPGGLPGFIQILGNDGAENRLMLSAHKTFRGREKETGANHLAGGRRKYVNTIALAVNKAQSQKAMLKVPVISAKNPATAGPAI